MDAQDAMKTCNENLRCKMYQQHMIELHESINLLRHAPILFEENCLKPMNITSINDTSWGTELWLSVDYNELLPAEKTQHNEATLFDGCSFTTENRSELPSCKPSTRGSRYKDVHPDTPLPDFSMIDFDQQPMRWCASLIIQNYVVSHIGYEDSKIETI